MMVLYDHSSHLIPSRTENTRNMFRADQVMHLPSFFFEPLFHLFGFFALKSLMLGRRLSVEVSSDPLIDLSDLSQITISVVVI